MGKYELPEGFYRDEQTPGVQNTARPSLPIIIPLNTDPTCIYSPDTVF